MRRRLTGHVRRDFCPSVYAESTQDPSHLADQVQDDTLEDTMCTHIPACPDTTADNCCTAHVVADRSDQGWCRLCNGVILFDDGHYLTPDGHDAEIALSA